MTKQQNGIWLSKHNMKSPQVRIIFLAELFSYYINGWSKLDCKIQNTKLYQLLKSSLLSFTKTVSFTKKTCLALHGRVCIKLFARLRLSFNHLGFDLVLIINLDIFSKIQ